MDFNTRQAGDLVPVSGLLMVAGVIFGAGAVGGVVVALFLTGRL
jgi:hypothetical protein